MIPNGHITIYNKYIHTDRSEKWQRSEIRNVVWQSTKAVSRMREMTAANSALILIPFSAGNQHLDAKAWQILRSLGGSEGFWTLQEGDIVVRGLVTDEIDTEYTITDLRAEHENVFAIATIDAMDQGSDYVQHWEVVCK